VNRAPEIEIDQLIVQAAEVQQEINLLPPESAVVGGYNWSSMRRPPSRKDDVIH
jgi:hypothetical protein